jgi:hypothetical protein
LTILRSTDWILIILNLLDLSYQNEYFDIYFIFVYLILTELFHFEIFII